MPRTSKKHCDDSALIIKRSLYTLRNTPTSSPKSPQRLHEEPTYLRHTTERHRKQVALIQLGLLRQPSFHILLRSKRTYGQPLPLLLSFFRPRNEHETAGSGGGSAENVWFPAPLDVALYLSRRAPPKRVFFHPQT